jgi:hypothetical protein
VLDSFPKEPPMRQGCRFLPLLLLAASLSGCGIFVPPEADPALAQQLSQLVYPKDAPLGADLDIVIVRHGSEIQLVNRTARATPAGAIWLNQQYVGLSQGLRIGTENTMDLIKFINEHGEAYPVGAVFQPEKSYPLVLAELFDPNTAQRHRLLVRPEPE